MKGTGKISKEAKATWTGFVAVRRIGETLFFRCPSQLGFAGADDYIPAFVGLAWEDKLVKILQGPYLTSVMAAVDIGSCAFESAFENCTAVNSNGVKEFKPIESTEVRVGLVSPQFSVESAVDAFENRLRPTC